MISNRPLSLPCRGQSHQTVADILRTTTLEEFLEAAKKVEGEEHLNTIRSGELCHRLGRMIGLKSILAAVPVFSKLTFSVISFLNVICRNLFVLVINTVELIIY